MARKQGQLEPRAIHVPQPRGGLRFSSKHCQEFASLEPARQSVSHELQPGLSPAISQRALPARLQDRPGR